MVFDIVIGNPPYNDNNDMQTKSDVKKTGQATFYKLFIDKATTWVKQDGSICYILPPGAIREFTRNNLYINAIKLIPLSAWPKGITARWYITSFAKNTTKIVNDDIRPFIKWNQNKLSNSIRISGGGLGGDSMCRPDKIMTNYPGSLPWVKLELLPTNTNRDNFKTLLTVLNPYLKRYAFQWSTWHKLIDYQWIEGKTVLTEQDIKQHYGI